MKYFKDEYKSEDTVLDVFESLTQKVKKHEIENFKTWVYRVMTNHCIDVLRKNKPSIASQNELSLIADLSYDLIDEMKEKEKIYKKIKQCIDVLEDGQRETILQFYFNEKSYKEISEEMHISWDQTRSLIQNGKRNLKNCMLQK